MTSTRKYYIFVILDEITLEDFKKEKQLIIKFMKKIDPYDSSCTSQKTDGKKVTVITCIDNGKNRFYAKARENNIKGVIY